MNAPPVPWYKHWRVGLPTAPRAERRIHIGSRLAGIFARRTYELALKAHGENADATRAARGRLNFYRGVTLQQFGGHVETVAYVRESGTQPGYWNRSRRRHFDRTIQNMISASEAPSV